MAGNPRIPVLELDDESWAELAQVIGQFEQSWKTSPGVEIDRFVPAADHRLRERILVELIKSDQEFRWQRGEQRRLEEYLSRWSGLDARPELVLELVEAECLTRAVLGEPVGGDELQSRFPDLADRVDLAQIGREAKSERGGFHPTAFHSPRLDTPTRDLEQTPSAAVDKHILKSGERFGRYEVHELLGRGGMGTVYRVFDTNLHREVALKIPRFDPMSDPEAVARFVREARTAAGIRHPNVCPVYDAGEIDGTYFITMALIKGRSLDEWAAGRVVDPHEAAEL
ncbi:MAG: hypothetical protein HUU20_24485, partial [Pirellulales bacterium]|nr:hypothetical protein [Pirellulales bacterium]